MFKYVCMLAFMYLRMLVSVYDFEVCVCRADSYTLSLCDVAKRPATSIEFSLASCTVCNSLLVHGSLLCCHPLHSSLKTHIRCVSKRVFYSTRSYSIIPYPILSYSILPYPTLPYSILPYPILPYPTLSYPTLPRTLCLFKHSSVYLCTYISQSTG